MQFVENENIKKNYLKIYWGREFSGDWRGSEEREGRGEVSESGEGGEAGHVAAKREKLGNKHSCIFFLCFRCALNNLNLKKKRKIYILYEPVFR